MLNENKPHYLIIHTKFHYSTTSGISSVPCPHAYDSFEAAKAAGEGMKTQSKPGIENWYTCVPAPYMSASV